MCQYMILDVSYRTLRTCMLYFSIVDYEGYKSKEILLEALKKESILPITDVRMFDQVQISLLPLID